jgi:PAS domain S-box-containing protein
MKNKKLGINEKESSLLKSNSQLENELADISSEWNNLIINANPDFIFSIDRTGRFTSVNDTLCKAMRISHARIIGKTNAEIGFSKEICKEWEGLHAQVYQSNSTVESITSAPRPDGNIYFYKVILHPLHDAHGNITGIGGIMRDITEYKEINDELKKSQREFYKVMQNAPDIIGIYSEGKVVFINKKGIELLKGNSKEDIPGKFMLEFVHKHFEDLVKNRAQAVEKKQVALSALEEKFICLDGSFIDVEVRAIPIRFMKKESVLVIARDISERKKAETAIKMERSLFRTVIDNIPDSIYVKDINGRKIIANPQELKYMGVATEEEAIGKTDFDVYSEENAELYAIDDNIVLKKGRTILNHIEFLFDNQNQKHWLLTSKVPLRNEQNEIIGLVGIGHNITDQHRMNEQLSENKERLNKIIQSSSDWVWELDMDGKYTYCSDKVENILGYSARELIGKTPFELMPKNESKKVEAYFKEIIHEKDHIIDLERWHFHKDGHQVCLLTNVYPFFDQQGNLKGYLGIDKNITNRKIAEKQIKELNEKLNTLIEAIPDAIFFKDSEGRWTIINGSAKKIFRLDNDDWVGKNDMELALQYPDFASIHQVCIQSDKESWQSGKLTDYYEIITDKEGICHQYQVRKVPLFESDGKRKGLVIIKQDISKSKSEEQRLRLLETVILNSTEGIVIASVDNKDLMNPKAIFVNDAYLKITGYEREELIGKPPVMMQGVNTDKNEINRINEAFKKREACEIEIINYKKNGESFWARIAVAPVLDEKGDPLYWIGITKDITDSKKQEQKIKKAIIAAQEQEKYFIGRELHDNIAQLLIGSLLTLGMVKPVTEKDSLWLKETSEHIHNSIDEIRKLSHHLAPATFKGESLAITINDLCESRVKNKSREPFVLAICTTIS